MKRLIKEIDFLNQELENIPVYLNSTKTVPVTYINRLFLKQQIDKFGKQYLFQMLEYSEKYNKSTEY